MKIVPAAALALAVSLCPVAPAAAQPADAGEAEEPGQNLLVTLTLGQVSGGAPRSYRFVARSGETTRMIVGFRMPIPTARSGEDDAEEGMELFVYQNVGLSANLRPLLMKDGRVRVTGQIEVSGTNEAELRQNQQGMPMIGTFQQDLDVLLREKRALRVAEGPDPAGGQRYLDVTVERLD